MKSKKSVPMTMFKMFLRVLEASLDKKKRVHFYDWKTADKKLDVYTLR